MSAEGQAEGPTAPRCGVWRGDFARVLHSLGDGSADAVAESFGLREAPPEPPAKKETAPSGRSAPRRVPQRGPSLPLVPIPFLRPVTYKRLEPVEPSAPGGESPVARPEFETPPSRRDIRPWPRLWPALVAALRQVLDTGRVDLEEAVDRVARCERLDSLPRRQWSTWGPQAAVVLDRSRHLTPLWPDLDDVAMRLARLAPLGSLVFRAAEAGAELEGDDPFELSELNPGAPILLVSDVGLYADDSRRRLWRRLVAQLRSSGHSVSTLLPAASGALRTSERGLFRPIVWEERTAAPALDQVAAVREQLLDLLSLSLVAESSVLRELREMVEGASVGTELGVWSDPAVLVRSPVGLALSADERDERRRRLWRESPEKARAALRAITRRHAASQPEEVLLSEIVGSLLLAPEGTGLDPSVERWCVDRWKRRHRELHGHLEVTSGDAPPSSPVALFMLRELARSPDELYRHDLLGELSRRSWALSHRHDSSRQPPDGVSVADLAAELGGELEPSTWSLHQVRDEWRLVPASSETSVRAPGGSPITRITMRQRLLDLRGDSHRQVHRTASSRAPRVPVGSRVTLETDLERIELDTVIRRHFDADAPGEHHELGWAEEVGRDRFGLWARFEIEDVSHRMRWIPPGAFWMGSPESEKGRYDDEDLHHVTISRGFWLGETPVTQELYEVVTGENPSEFPSPRRPVERVSWEDTKTFMEAISQRLKTDQGSADRRWRLPSEAEWERACRAGTQTSTYAGDAEWDESYRSEVLGRIGWYNANADRGFELENGQSPVGRSEEVKAGTHEVGLKQPNAHGLYDFLGNVHEWCVDAVVTNLGGEPVTNPYTKASEGGLSRVVRGGSWIDRPRSLRSAYRHWYDPGDRYDFLGFRLARGPSLEPSRRVGDAKEGPELGAGRAGEGPERSRS